MSSTQIQCSHVSKFCLERLQLTLCNTILRPVMEHIYSYIYFSQSKTPSNIKYPTTTPFRSPAPASGETAPSSLPSVSDQSNRNSATPNSPHKTLSPNHASPPLRHIAHHNPNRRPHQNPLPHPRTAPPHLLRLLQHHPRHRHRSRPHPHHPLSRRFRHQHRAFRALALRPRCRF